MQNTKFKSSFQMKNRTSSGTLTFFTYITREMGMMSHMKENENAQISDHVNICFFIFV